MKKTTILCPHCLQETPLDDEYVCSECGEQLTDGIIELNEHATMLQTHFDLVQNTHIKHLTNEVNTLLEGSGLTVSVYETSEIYGKDDMGHKNEDANTEDPYFGMPMYEANLQDKNEDVVEDTTTGRYCDLFSVREEIIAFAKNH